MIKVLQRIYNKNNLLIINAYLEIEENTPKEKIFFEFYSDYSRTKAIKISLKLMDLRQLKYAFQEVIKKGETKFIKYTQSKEKKSLTLNSNYITANNLTQNFHIGFSFENYYEFLAFKDEVDFFIKAIEEAYIFWYKK